MRKQDRIAIRTPEQAAQVSRAQLQRLSDGVALTVENKETITSIQLKVGDKIYPATIDLKGVVTFADLKTPGSAQLHGGNIITGTVSAELITAGVLRSRDEKSIILDLDRGCAHITGSVGLLGQNETGELVGALEPGMLRLTQLGALEEEPEAEDEQLHQTEEPEEEPEIGILQQVELTQNCLSFTDPVREKSLALRLEEAGGRLTGLADPVDSADAVSKGFLEAYVRQELQKLRQELGLEAE
jgi:hypothetical protein